MRYDYTPHPTCPHYDAARAQYESAREAHAATHRWHDCDGCPEEPDHYCEACRAELFRPGAVWPPEVWAWLNKVAREHSHPDVNLRPYTLPPGPKPRHVKAEQWIAQALKAYSPGKDPSEQRAHDYVGRPIGPDETGQLYTVTTTNGHCLLARPTSTPASAIDPKSIVKIPITAGPYWIDLPPDLHLAIRRVRLLANERSSALTITLTDDDHTTARLTLHGSSYQYGEASEWIPIAACDRSRELPAGFTTCLSADYLDPLCGCWPVRWYLRPPVVKTPAPSRYDPTPRPYTEDYPQLFAPAGTDARVLIMPMRI